MLPRIWPGMRREDIEGNRNTHMTPPALIDLTGSALFTFQILKKKKNTGILIPIFHEKCLHNTMVEITNDKICPPIPVGQPR